MRLRFLLPLLTLAALSVPAVAPATADPLSRTAANRLTDAELDAYWTPERVANAEPAPTPEVLPTRTATRTATQDGPAIAVPGKTGTARGLNETTGRLLFSQNGRDWVCSATVVASENASVIATARHCGFTGTTGSRFRFAPSYDAGKAPLGWWNWRSAGWVSDGDKIADDHAFIVLRPRDGYRVGDVVGTSALGFNFAVDAHAYVVGIPSATGRRTRCEGDAHPGPAGRQLMDDCDGMSHGASGGSWSQRRHDTGLYQTGTFFGRSGSAMAGSYYGSLAHDVWEDAQSA